jgi:hypothetical protein
MWTRVGSAVAAAAGWQFPTRHNNPNMATADAAAESIVATVYYTTQLRVHGSGASILFRSFECF